MRRADRLFDIIQILRAERRPVTASRLASRLEVAVRTVYRDVAALQASGVPVEGAAGLGYVLRDGYDLPPLMFTPDEVRVVEMAVRLMRRTGDHGLQEAAERLQTKIQAVLPHAVRRGAGAVPVFVSGHGAGPAAVCMDDVRTAIRDAKKLEIFYVDRDERTTCRRIWPLGLVYWTEATLIGAWCELRAEYRHFRADRITALATLDEAFPTGQTLLEGWRALHAGHQEGESQ